LGTEFCIENVTCDIDGELSHGIMWLLKIIIGKIGEKMWHWACYGHVGIAGVVMVDEIMENGITVPFQPTPHLL